MNKKGITFGYVIAAIIAVIILITLVLVFKESLRASLEPLFGIIKSTNATGSEVGERIKDLA